MKEEIFRISTTLTQFFLNQPPKKIQSEYLPSHPKVERKSDKAIGRHTKKQNNLFKYSYSLQANKLTENFNDQSNRSFFCFPNSFSAFCPIFTIFCLIACLRNAGPSLPLVSYSPHIHLGELEKWREDN